MSSFVISWSLELIPTTPLLLMPFIWSPPIPMITDEISVPAWTSASPITLEIVFIVCSMLTMEPFFTPSLGRSTTLSITSCPSLETEPTATLVELVPISNPTIVLSAATALPLYYHERFIKDILLGSLHHSIQ